MKCRMFRIVALVGLIGIGCSGKSGAQQDVTMASGLTVDAMAEGRRLTQMFFDRELAAIVERFSPEMAAAMTLDQFTAFRNQIDEQIGTEVEVLHEDLSMRGEAIQVYARRARFDKLEPSIDVVWVLNEEAMISGFVVRGAPIAFDSAFLDYQPVTRLRLPFDGAWTVFWGGRTIEENYHAGSEDQRFAMDLVKTEGGSRHAGDGTSNSDYYCWEEPIFAPGPGVVVASIDGIADNAPGRMNPVEPLGNHVIIDHGNSEFSFLAHLVDGSVAVHLGDAVEAGQLIGRCGNSGNSSEPHLHYHLQNTSGFGEGDGLPAYFYDYTADGARVPRGEPKQGQVIANRK